MSVIIRDLTPISEATTNRCPSSSSPWTQTSIDRDARSVQDGITTSVRTIGFPKSRVTNRRAPIKKNPSP